MSVSQKFRKSNLFYSFILLSHVLIVWALVIPFKTLVFRVTDFNWEDDVSRCCLNNDGKNGHRFFFRIPALKIRRYFTGITAEKHQFFSSGAA